MIFNLKDHRREKAYRALFRVLCRSFLFVLLMLTASTGSLHLNSRLNSTCLPLSSSSQKQEPVELPYSKTVSGDFDGDNKQDSISCGAEGDNYEIEIRLSGREYLGSLKLKRAESPILGIFSKDLDEDNDQDLIVLSEFYEPPSVWLNDGHGNFTKENNIPFFHNDDLPGYGKSDRHAASTIIQISGPFSFLAAKASPMPPELETENLTYERSRLPILKVLKYSLATRGPPAQSA